MCSDRGRDCEEEGQNGRRAVEAGSPEAREAAASVGAHDAAECAEAAGAKQAGNPTVGRDSVEPLRRVGSSSSRAWPVDRDLRARCCADGTKSRPEVAIHLCIHATFLNHALIRCGVVDSLSSGSTESRPTFFAARRRWMKTGLGKKTPSALSPGCDFDFAAGAFCC